MGKAEVAVKIFLVTRQSQRMSCNESGWGAVLHYSMIVKLLTEHHLEFLSLEVGCTGSSESTLVKMSNCWKSHAAYVFYTHTRNRLKGECVLTVPYFSSWW